MDPQKPKDAPPGIEYLPGGMVAVRANPKKTAERDARGRFARWRERREAARALGDIIQSRVLELHGAIAAILIGQRNVRDHINALEGGPFREQPHTPEELALLAQLQQRRDESAVVMKRLLDELATLEGSLERQRAHTYRKLQLLTGGLTGTIVTILARRLLTGTW